jgi:putative flippase GtrA
VVHGVGWPSMSKMGEKRGLREQGAGFVVSGALAFLVDMGMLSLLTRWAGLNPLLARIIGIGFAMCVAWMAHRRLTFAVQTPPTLIEFARYVGVASLAVTFNYGLFSLGLWIMPTLAPELMLVASSLGAMTVSYLGMRYGVFAHRS